jgi:hypothetical protein
MPNWCSNNITISGPVETIKTLWDEANSEDGGLLNAMVPMPKELKDTTSPSDLDQETQALMIKKFGASDWYSWCVNNWGTKWDINTEGLEFTDNGDGTASIDGWFESAWAPPIGAYEKFLDDMDNCSINASYYEMGMDYAGFWVDGEDRMLEGCHDEFKLPEDERSGLYNELDEEWNLSEQYEQYDDDEE